MSGFEEAGAAAVIMGGAGALGTWFYGKRLADGLTAPSQNKAADPPPTPVQQTDKAKEGADKLAKAPAAAASSCCPPGDPDEPNKDRDNKNKVDHVFDNPNHKLDGFLNSFGGDKQQAYDALQQAVQNSAKPLSGFFENTVNVNGFDITVRGATIGGDARISTAFIP